jgi:acetoacetyl-CoA synthetase
LFIMHGLGGDFRELAPFARHIGSTHAVYALQVAGAAAPTVAELAWEHLRILRSRQPHGPWLLAGFSFGGLVMLEVARLLLESQENVAMLALIDSYPHCNFWPADCRLEVTCRTLARRARKLVKRRGVPLSPANAIPSARTTNRSHLESLTDPALPAEIRNINASSYEAWMGYTPRTYPGKVVFIRSAIGTTFPRDPTRAWRGMLRRLTVYTTPGDHVTMISTYAADLAGRLTECLNEHEH